MVIGVFAPFVFGILTTAIFKRPLNMRRDVYLLPFVKEFRKLYMVLYKLDENESCQNFCITASYLETAFESVPQFILQSSIVWRTGFVDKRTQASSLILSYISIVKSCSLFVTNFQCLSKSDTIKLNALNAMCVIPKLAAWVWISSYLRNYVLITLLSDMVILYASSVILKACSQNYSDISWKEVWFFPLALVLPSLKKNCGLNTILSAGLLIINLMGLAFLVHTPIYPYIQDLPYAVASRFCDKHVIWITAFNGIVAALCLTTCLELIGSLWITKKLPKEDHVCDHPNEPEQESLLSRMERALRILQGENNRSLQPV